MRIARKRLREHRDKCKYIASRLLLQEFAAGTRHAGSFRCVGPVGEAKWKRTIPVQRPQLPDDKPLITKHFCHWAVTVTLTWALCWSVFEVPVIVTV
jgi:hypothetical protein